jgi:hypothetical protein
MAEAKATKLKFLEFMSQRELITAYDLMGKFGYSYSYAYKKLSLLKRQGLVQDVGDTPAISRGQWCLTDKGIKRLHFLQQKKEEQGKVVKQQEILEKEEITRYKKRIKELEERVGELEDLVEIFRSPGGLEGKVSRLLDGVRKVAAAYSQAEKQGINPENVDFGYLTSRIQELLKYSEYLPPEKRSKIQKELRL